MRVRQSLGGAVEVGELLLPGVEPEEGFLSDHWDSICCTHAWRPHDGSLYLSHWLRELAAPWKG